MLSSTGHHVSWRRSSPCPCCLPAEGGWGHTSPEPHRGTGTGTGDTALPTAHPTPLCWDTWGQMSAGKTFLNQPLTAKFPKRQDQHRETTSMQRRGKRRRCRNLIICSNLLISACHVNSLQLLMWRLLTSLALRQVLWLLVGCTQPKFTCCQPA